MFSLSRCRVCQSASFVVVRLKRIEQAGDGFTNTFTIACAAVAGLLVVNLQIVASKGLLANNRERAIIASIDVLNEQPNRTPQGSDLGLEVDNTIGGVIVHRIAIGAKPGTRQ